MTCLPSSRPRTRPTLRQLIGAACLSVMLQGCATSTPTRVEVRRDLPQRPSWAIPVEVPAPKAGEDARLVGARERAGRYADASVILAFGAWYDTVRAEYAGGAGK